MTHRQPTKHIHIPARDPYEDMDEFESPMSPWLEIVLCAVAATILILGMMVVFP